MTVQKRDALRNVTQFPKRPLDIGPAIPTLSIDQLEAGLAILCQDDLDHGAFWDEHIVAFRRTLLLAIGETSDALRSPTLTARWRVELDRQLQGLKRHIAMADRYVAQRAISAERPVPAPPPAVPRIH